MESKGFMLILHRIFLYKSKKGDAVIEFVTGDMFESGADCLINTVNCEGFMGKGVAYQFKMRFPMNNNEYVKACKSGSLRIGTIHYCVENGVTIINFPTKDRWREKSKMKYIETGMSEFVGLLPQLGVSRIAIPPLGCGNGGLAWDEVKRVIVEYLTPVKEQYSFLVYEPSGSYSQIPKQPPKLYLSSLVVMQIKMQLEKCTALRLQKTAFLMNYFYGEEYFKFDKYKYGPYSYSLELITKNIGEYQKCYNISDTEETYNMVYRTLCSDKTENKLTELDKAIHLATAYVNKIKDTKFLEGVSTVLYLVKARKNNNITEEDIQKQFKAWSEDKAARFSEKEISECIQYLDNTGLIEKNVIGNYEITEWNAWY